MFEWVLSERPVSSLALYGCSLPPFFSFLFWIATLLEGVILIPGSFFLFFFFPCTLL